MSVPKLHYVPEDRTTVVFHFRNRQVVIKTKSFSHMFGLFSYDLCFMSSVYMCHPIIMYTVSSQFQYLVASLEKLARNFSN